MTPELQRIAQLEEALRDCYRLVYWAWNDCRFGEDQADEAKELRREVWDVLESAGLDHPLGWGSCGRVVDLRGLDRNAALQEWRRLMERSTSNRYFTIKVY